MIAFDSRFLDGSIPAFELAIRPRMFYFCQMVVNPIFLQHISNMCVMYRGVGPLA